MISVIGRCKIEGLSGASRTVKQEMLNFIETVFPHPLCSGNNMADEGIIAAVCHSQRTHAAYAQVAGS